MTLITNLEVVVRNIMQFQISSRKERKRYLSHTEDNKSGPLNIGGVADILLSRTLLTQKFWGLIEHFLLLV